MASGRQQRADLIRASVASDAIMDESIQEEGCDRTRKEVQGRVRMEPRLEGRRDRKEKVEIIIQRL